MLLLQLYTQRLSQSLAHGEGLILGCWDRERTHMCLETFSSVMLSQTGLLTKCSGTVRLLVRLLPLQTALGKMLTPFTQRAHSCLGTRSSLSSPHRWHSTIS